MKSRTPSAALFALVCTLGLACGRADRPDARSVRTVPRPEAPDVGLAGFALGDGGMSDGDSPETGIDPERRAALAGPLAGCIRRVAQGIPAELAGAFETLEYPQLTEDACRLDLASSFREPLYCAGIALSALRESCRLRAAMVMGRPDDCPTVSPDRGRDATCLAIASRNAALCAAAGASQIHRCLAIAHVDPRECDRLDTLLRPRCRADSRAVAAAGVSRIVGMPLAAGTFHLRVVFGANGSPADAGITREWDLDAAARGVFLDEAGRVYFVEPYRGWPSPFASSVLHHDRPIVGLAATVPARRGTGPIVDVRIVMPDGRVIEAAATVAPGVVNYTSVARARGGLLEGTFTLETSYAGMPVHLDGAFRTFVRDVVTPEALGR